MKRKFVAFFVLLLVASQIFSQERIPFGRSDDPEIAFDEVRALVLGISNYRKLPLEKQLDYAADDAMAFYNFLKARPDIIKPRNIVALFNEEATNKIRIESILYNLIVKESDKNDLVIIYYAGHGDIQNFNASTEEGFLLLHEVSQDGDYMAPGNDVIEISEIQKYISLAPEGVKVLLITDACHSGKLVSSQKAAQKVLTSLIQEWEKTYKLVSCQPNQLSYENKKWGGGHGVFTYYLLYGLKGLADENKDEYLQFFELYDFVKEKVQKATNYKQIPKAKGDETVTFFPVDSYLKKKALAKYPHKGEFQGQKEEGSYTPLLYQQDRSGGDYFYRVPSNKRYLLKHFQKLVEEGKLIPEYTDDSKSVGSFNVSEVKHFKAHNKNAFAVAVSNDGEVIATGGRDQVIRLWNISTLEQIGTLEHRGVKSLRFSFNDRYLISGSWDNQVKVWNLEEKKAEYVNRAHSDDILTISFSRNGKYMATGGYGDSVKLWDLSRWQIIRSYHKIHKGAVNDLLFVSPEAFVTAGADGKIIKRSLENGAVLHQANREAGVKDLFYMSDNNWLFSVDKSGNLTRLASDNLSLLNQWNISQTPLNTITGASNASCLFLGGTVHEIKIFNFKEGKVIRKIKVPRGITKLDVNPYQGILAGVMFGGHGVCIHLKNYLPPPAGNAYENYMLLQSSPEIKHLHDRIRGYFASALQSFAVGVINPFINGKENLPSMEKIQQAKTYLHYAEKLYPKENVITQRMQINKKLLDIFEIMIAHQYKNIPEAIEKVKEIMKVHEDASYTYNTLSNLYRRLNELKKAKESGKIAANRIPGWTEPKASLGQAYFKEGSYEEALKEFDKIVELRPEIAKGYKYKGDVYAFLGNYEKAGEEYQTAEKKDSGNPGILLRKARLRLMKSDFTGAEKILRKCIDSHPNYTESQILLGRMYHYRFLDSYEKTGKVRDLLFEKSYQQLFHIHKQFPRLPGPKKSLAELYLTVYQLKDKLKKNKWNKLMVVLPEQKPHKLLHRAFHLYTSVTVQNPFDPKAKYGVARCKLSSGHFDKAKEYMKEYIDLVPEQPDGYFYLGRLYVDNGKYIEGREYLKKAIKKDPLYFPAYYFMLYSYDQQKDQNKIGNWLKSFSEKKGRKEWRIHAKKLFDSPVFISDVGVYRYSMVRFMN
jgi:WD40 repeat protein/tetratricopeptide (TPR) repeat protein